MKFSTMSFPNSLVSNLFLVCVFSPIFSVNLFFVNDNMANRVDFDAAVLCAQLAHSIAS